MRDACLACASATVSGFKHFSDRLTLTGRHTTLPRNVVTLESGFIGQLASLFKNGRWR